MKQKENTKIDHLKFGYHKFCRQVEKGEKQKYYIEGKGKQTQPRIHTPFQRKLKNELTNSKNRHLHNNNASPNIDLQCISRPKQ